MSTLTRRIGILGSARAINRLSLLLVAVLLSRLLDKADYGNFQYVLLIYRTAFPFLTIGIPASILFFYVRLEGDAQLRFIWQTLECLGVLALLGALIFFWGSEPFGRGVHRPEVVPLLRVFALYVFSGVLVSFAEPLFISLNRQKLILGVSLISSSLALLLLWVLVSQTQSVYWALVGLGVAVSFKLVLFLSQTLRVLGKPHLGINIALLTRQLRYAVPVALTEMVGILAHNTNALLVAAFFSATEFAIYSNGSFEIPFIGILVSSVAAVVIPEFSQLLGRGDSATVRHIWHNGIRKLALILFAVFAVFLVCAEDVMVLLFSESYRESAHYFRIFLLLIPLRALFVSSILLAAGHTKPIFYASLGDLILNFLLGLWLVQHWGSTGPAWAVVISTYLQVLVYLIWVCKALKVSFWQVLPFKSLLEIGGISGIAMLGGYAAGRYIESTLWHLAGCGTVTLLIFAGLWGLRSFLFRLSTSQDKPS